MELHLPTKQSFRLFSYRTCAEPLVTCLLLIAFTSCTSLCSDSSQTLSSDRIEINGNELTREAPPTEVARFAVLAIQKQDFKTLNNMIAAQHVKYDLAQITKGKTQFSKWTADATQTSAKAIAMNLSGLNPPVSFSAEKVDGDAATVTVTGAGETHGRTVRMRREQSRWMLVPSVR